LTTRSESSQAGSPNTQKPMSTKNVSVSELKPGMIILAYTRFSATYDNLAEVTSNWLKLNFKGARSVIVRGGKRLDVPVDATTAGDRLIRLYRFPERLSRKARVSERLAFELKKRGFLGFEIRDDPSRRPTDPKRVKALQQTQALIVKTRRSLEIRNQLVEEVESLIDETRRGRLNLKGVWQSARIISEESLSEAFAAISSLKRSDQTYAHSLDVSALFHWIASRLPSVGQQPLPLRNDQEILIGGFVHDIGKAKVPKEILESTEKFAQESIEMRLIRQHAKFGADLLTKLNIAEPIVTMAHFHHVKLDHSLLSSYPAGTEYRNVPRETRLLALVDIYQALTGQRSYKKPWTPTKAMVFIQQLVDSEFDAETFTVFYRLLGRYPVGSLVELTDRSLAFVTSVPDLNLARPQVVVIRNGQGEDLTHHHLMDLQEEADLAIARDLSGYDVFGENAVSVFANLNVS